MYLDQGLPPIEAAKQTLTRLHGAFALCFLFDGQDDLMIAARKGSPLAIGHGTGEMYVGSDAIALLMGQLLQSLERPKPSAG
jgi:glucosamine--fructose-6-phosphate aminotransferase (isomerizing)